MGVLPLISVSARSAPNPSMGEGVGCCVHIVDADSGDSGSKLTALTSSLGQLIVRGGRGQCQLWPHYVDEWGGGREACVMLTSLVVCV